MAAVLGAVYSSVRSARVVRVATAAIASSHRRALAVGCEHLAVTPRLGGVSISVTAPGHSAVRSAAKGLSMAGVLRVPRSRGAFSGVVLVLLGAWGALIPFIGPYFQFAYTPGTAWVYTPARLWLEIVPGVAAAAGGLILLSSANRALAAFGAWLAALAGAWFVLGPTVSRLWASSGVSQIGSPLGGTLRRTEISYFAGLGVVIVFFAALALGRLAVVATRDAELAPATAGRGTGMVPARDAEPAATATG